MMYMFDTFKKYKIRNGIFDKIFIKKTLKQKYYTTFPCPPSNYKVFYKTFFKIHGTQQLLKRSITDININTYFM